VLDVYHGVGAVEIDHVDGEAHSKRMDAAAGPDPESASVQEVGFRCAQQATQSRPVRIGYRQFGRKIALAGLVESLAAWDDSRHKSPDPLPLGYRYSNFSFPAN
jgi:hypothetical protein